MKWLNLLPSLPAFPILPLLLLPLPNDAGAAVPRAMQPRPPAAATAPGGIADPSAAAQPGQKGFITEAVPVNHRPGAEMRKILQPLVTPGGAVRELPDGKTLTIVDSPSNIRILIEIKELIDSPIFVGARLDSFEPKKASAEELAAAMSELTRNYLFPVQRDEAAPVELIPFPRTNHILVVIRSENAWAQARPWLERIDASSGFLRRIFVYPVERDQAVELAAKLNPVKNGAPRAVLDPVASLLVFYGTTEEFRELKKILSGRLQIEEFKQRLSPPRQKAESTLKKDPVPTP